MRVFGEEQFSDNPLHTRSIVGRHSSHQSPHSSPYWLSERYRLYSRADACDILDYQQPAQQ